MEGRNLCWQSSDKFEFLVVALEFWEQLFPELRADMVLFQISNWNNLKLLFYYNLTNFIILIFSSLKPKISV